jgi:hypothetical protein
VHIAKQMAQYSQLHGSADCCDEKKNTKITNKYIAQLMYVTMRSIGGRDLSHRQPPPGFRKFQPSKLKEQKTN